MLVSDSHVHMQGRVLLCRLVQTAEAFSSLTLSSLAMVCLQNAARGVSTLALCANTLLHCCSASAGLWGPWCPWCLKSTFGTPRLPHEYQLCRIFSALQLHIRCRRAAHQSVSHLAAAFAP